MADFDTIYEFEKSVAEFFGSPYAIAVDSCTHGIELCLRYEQVEYITVPVRTYLSVALLGDKLDIDWDWDDREWQDYYFLGDSHIADAAILWKPGSYVPGSYMCISFQYQKHLSLGRGGMILLDDKQSYEDLVKMSYDGRERGIPWRDQNIKIIGYHYYMTPETAQLGLDKLPNAIASKPRDWVYLDWPDLREMDIFK